MAAEKPTASESAALERKLVESAQRDPSRFADLYELYFDQVYAFVIRRVRERSSAEDITSEVFHKALANLKQFEWRGAPFGSWLLRIAANAIADQMKRAQRDAGSAVNAPEPSVEPEIEGVEDRARLFRLVRSLPEDQRRVIHARFVEQRSIREIAEQMGRSEGAVKQLQVRAIENLRAQMEGGHG